MVCQSLNAELRWRGADEMSSLLTQQSDNEPEAQECIAGVYVEQTGHQEEAKGRCKQHLQQ